MKLFSWTEGRQESGYRVFTLLFSKLLKADAYLIHYRTGSSIPEHVDPVNNGRMYRLNIELIRPEEGGVFYCKNLIFNWRNRIILFRPDENPHYVTEITKGERWVFSVGKVLNENKN